MSFKRIVALIVCGIVLAASYAAVVFHVQSIVKELESRVEELKSKVEELELELKIKKLESYVHIMAYTQIGGSSIRTNASAQEMLIGWVRLAKDMGFKGIAVNEYELYLLDDYLDDYLQLIQQNNLYAAICILWRDWSINVSIGNIDWHFWWTSDFPNNSTKCQLWINVVKNLVNITRKYPNVKYYLVYYPFRWWYGSGQYKEANLQNSTGYKYWMQKVVDAIRELDDKPILLVSDGIEMELNNWEILPYDIEGINGYGFTYFSKTPNELNETALKQYVNFYREKISTHLKGKGKLFLAEWGWHTKGAAGPYGGCESEKRKCELIKETLKAICEMQIAEDPASMPHSYFAIQDFGPENADWGLAYYNQTLKPSGEALKKLLN